MTPERRAEINRKLKDADLDLNAITPPAIKRLESNRKKSATAPGASREELALLNDAQLDKSAETALRMMVDGIDERISTWALVCRNLLVALLAEIDRRAGPPTFRPGELRVYPKHP
jgi:hypothetical protein